MKCIQWLNVNDGFVMSILTLIYVIATILICIFNYKSASATKKQTEESKRQFEENNRAHVIPKLIMLEGQLYCLAFHNIGHEMAKDLIIRISPEWLNCLRETKKNSRVADVLSKLASSEIFLPIDEKYVYSLCIPADGTGDYFKLCEKPLVINLSYKSGDKPYDEKYVLPLNGINCIVNTSDYVRMEEKKRNSLRGIEKQIEYLNKQVESIMNKDE